MIDDDDDDDYDDGIDYDIEEEEDTCKHGCYPPEICDECDENGCNWSEDDPTCSCYWRE